MADKPEFVDLISEATSQSRRRSQPRASMSLMSRNGRASATGRRSGGSSGGWRR